MNILIYNNKLDITSKRIVIFSIIIQSLSQPNLSNGRMMYETLNLAHSTQIHDIYVWHMYKVATTTAIGKNASSNPTIQLSLKIDDRENIHKAIASIQFQE